jgi:MoaA/NifB/PqqE/SkfB family radical SAM enzyme
MFDVDYLDLVTIRSCQMGCEGCCTFSDHREINGLVEPDEEALAFWSKRINPGRLHLFGGEPTMHPRLIHWFRLAKKYWPTSRMGHDMPIWLNTNGYYLDKLFPHVKELFTTGNNMFVSVTHHTLQEPYNILVQNNFDRLLDLILQENIKINPDQGWHWVNNTDWDDHYKKFFHLHDNRGSQTIMLNICYQHESHFVPHYRGKGANLQPWQKYDDPEALKKNHEVCHIKNYVQIYQGRLYKCPPIGVLNQTLETYNLQNSDHWRDYYEKYESVGIHDSEETINAWFERQKHPENVCNMCGFMNSHEYFPAQEHLPKKLFKIKPE